MPAIHPARLKIQIARLADQFDDPVVFVHGLHELLDFYSDRTYRPGQAGKPPPLLASYNPPPPVMRHVDRALAPLAAARPTNALVMCDALWAEAYLEFRLLAAFLLGQIPPHPTEPVLSRLQTWIGSAPEDRLLDALLDQGLARLRTSSPGVPVELAEEWLAAPEAPTRRVGLRAMLALISDTAFENIPAVFRLISPWLRQPPTDLRVDLAEVLRALAHRSPQETAYLLRQILLATDNPDVPWLARQALPEFPHGIQESLRTAIR